MQGTVLYYKSLLISIDRSIQTLKEVRIGVLSIYRDVHIMLGIVSALSA